MKTSYLEKLQRLTGGNLDPEDFTHTDHVGVAYEALARSDFFHAAAQVARGIQALARRAGTPDKFNATITWAFMSLIAERMETTEHLSAEDFIERNPDLVCKSALTPWYSKQRLKSDLARSVALLPDMPMAAQ